MKEFINEINQKLQRLMKYDISYIEVNVEREDVILSNPKYYNF